MFGIGSPANVMELPPGDSRNRLQALPPRSRTKAMKWLQKFSFHETDLASIKIDSTGAVYYADSLLPNLAEALPDNDPPAVAPPSALTLADAFLLHSRPGAANTVYIDFDGHIISGTAWNDSVAQYDALPYDIDGDTNSFNDDERTRIVTIWQRVSEDLAPFDVDPAVR